MVSENFKAGLQPSIKFVGMCLDVPRTSLRCSHCDVENSGERNIPESGGYWSIEGEKFMEKINDDAKKAATRTPQHVDAHQIIVSGIEDVGGCKIQWRRSTTINLKISSPQAP